MGVLSFKDNKFHFMTTQSATYDGERKLAQAAGLDHTDAFYWSTRSALKALKLRQFADESAENKFKKFFTDLNLPEPILANEKQKENEMDKILPSVTITNVTPEQYRAITNILNGEKEETSVTDISKLKKATKTAKPAPTVSDEEDEDFGKKAVSAEDLEDEEAETDDAADEDSEEDEDESPGIGFKELRTAVNKLGEKKPEAMRAILLAFNMKSPKELSATRNEKYWEPVYRKVMAQLKTLKKGK